MWSFGKPGVLPIFLILEKSNAFSAFILGDCVQIKLSFRFTKLSDNKHKTYNLVRNLKKLKFGIKDFVLNFLTKELDEQ